MRNNYQGDPLVLEKLNADMNAISVWAEILQSAINITNGESTNENKTPSKDNINNLNNKANRMKETLKQDIQEEE